MLKTQKQSISVIVPAFNEELNLSDTVDSINASTLGRNLVVEIIIENCSKKNEYIEWMDLRSIQPNGLRILHHRHQY